MNVYIDEDTQSKELVARLRQAGHRVVLPKDSRLVSASDPRHLEYAIRNQLVMLTRNYDHFQELHELMQAGAGRHHGILSVRSDQDKSRDMTPAHIARAIHNLEQANAPIQNEAIVLNHWR